MLSVYLGVDVAKKKLDATLSWSEQERQRLGTFSNSETGIKKLAKRVRKLCQGQGDVPLHLVMEPTGGYERRLLYFAYEQEWAVTLVNPFPVRRWAEGMGVRAKTDQVDADLLSWYGAATQPAGQEPMDEAAQELDDLLRRRTDLEKLRQAERNRLDVAKHKPRTPVAVRKSIERTLQALEEELAALEKAIRHLLKQDAALRQPRRLLLSLPGVGQKISLYLLSLLHRFHARTSGQGTAKQLVAFVGLDPQPKQSGDSVYRRPTISRKGDRHMRTLLYLGALGGKSANNVLKPIFHRFIARGKAKKVALLACARRILVWAWAIFRSNSPFDPLRFEQPVQVAS